MHATNGFPTTLPLSSQWMLLISCIVSMVFFGHHLLNLGRDVFDLLAKSLFMSCSVALITA